MLRSKITVVAAAAILGLVVAGCGDDDTSDGTEAPSGTSGTADTAAPPDTAAPSDTGGGEAGESCIGEEGCVPANQPDVNQDGKVLIGVLSPGDTNDNGYYESFVVTAGQFADENGWEFITVDKVNPADAVEQARNICRQGVDMVAIAASELKDAIPVAEEDVCKGTVWYVAGGQGIEQTPFFFQSTEPPGPTQYVTGYAAGLVLQEIGGTKAGFITGPELDFAVTTYKAVKAGLQELIPDGDVIATYTGDFNDSAKAQEAARAQMAQGVQIMYPYLGGATDAVVEVAAADGVQSITPGTDRCAEENFAISSIFSPGDYFAAALNDFKAGTVKLGTARVYTIGVDIVPDVIICDSVPNADQLNADLDAFIEKVVSGEIDVQAEIDSVQ